MPTNTVTVFYYLCVEDATTESVDPAATDGLTPFDVRLERAVLPRGTWKKGDQAPRELELALQELEYKHYDPLLSARLGRDNFSWTADGKHWADPYRFAKLARALWARDEELARMCQAQKDKWAGYSLNSW
jgi:hypothetical protein